MPAVVDGVAGDVVPPPRIESEQTLLAREVDRVDDVGRARALHDQRRAPVDQPVPDGARLVVVRVAGPEHGAADTDAANSRTASDPGVTSVVLMPPPRFVKGAVRAILARAFVTRKGGRYQRLRNPGAVTGGRSVWRDLLEESGERRPEAGLEARQVDRDVSGLDERLSASAGPACGDGEARERRPPAGLGVQAGSADSAGLLTGIVKRTQPLLVTVRLLRVPSTAPSRSMRVARVITHPLPQPAGRW